MTIRDEKKEKIPGENDMKGEKKRENAREKSQPGVRSRVGFCAMLFFV